MGIKIITDSGSDIRQELARKWGVTVLPLSIRFGEEEFLDDPNFFIENAYQKCQSVDKYKISKTR